jgi:dTMP kinase
MRGKFITLEGIDGAGKSTHLPWLAKRLEERGIAIRATREPGGTPFGEALRGLLLDRNGKLGAETETLLMFAARREHLERIILPALQSGTWILCDRFTDATYAYQSGGSGVPWEKIELLERWVHPGLQPDLTLLFDVDPDIARRRAGAGRADRFEREDLAYFQRVREAYLRRARSDPERVQVIDAAPGLKIVQSSLEVVISSICLK